MRLPIIVLILTLAALPHPCKAGEIRAIDFRNFTYPWLPFGCRQANRKHSVALRGGSFLFDRDGTDCEIEFDLANVSYADLTGDGSEEAIVTVVALTYPHDSEACTYVYSRPSGAIRLLWKYQTGNGAFGGLRSLRVERGDLIVEQYDARSSDTPSPCSTCASRYLRATYHWNGTRFRRVREESIPHPEMGVEFLGYPDDRK